jgi:hypothetical protein
MENANKILAKRQYRKIALYCLLQCWVKKIDSGYLKRQHLEAMTENIKVEKARYDYMLSAFGEYFGYCRIVEGSSNKASEVNALMRGLIPEKPKFDESYQVETYGNGETFLGIRLFREHKDLDNEDKMLFHSLHQYELEFPSDVSEEKLSQYLAMIAQGFSPHQV